MQLHVGEQVDIDELRGFCESAGYILDERVDKTFIAEEHQDASAPISMAF